MRKKTFKNLCALAIVGMMTVSSIPAHAADSINTSCGVGSEVCAKVASDINSKCLSTNLYCGIVQALKNCNTNQVVSTNTGVSNNTNDAKNTGSSNTNSGSSKAGSNTNCNNNTSNTNTSNTNGNSCNSNSNKSNNNSKASTNGNCANNQYAFNGNCFNNLPGFNGNFFNLIPNANGSCSNRNQNCDNNSGNNKPNNNDKNNNVQPTTEAPTTEAPTTETPTTEAPTTEAPANNSSDTASLAAEVANIVNSERSNAGLSSLQVDVQLCSAAQVRANEIVSSFSHTRPSGSSFSSVLAEQGISYRGAGENIAWGQRSASEVMNAWMNSEGHRANILNANFTKIGVGVYQSSSGTLYWTQLFTY